MHHAYYIEGPLNLFEAYKKHLKPFWARTFEKFGIDEARELILQAQLKNFDATTFLVGVHSITSEAQQALLKLFEEPQVGTMFVLLLPHGSLISTLRSRMLPYPDVFEGEEGSGEAKKFLKSSHKDRSAYVAKLLKDDEGIKERVRELLNGLEVELAAGLNKTKGDKDFLDGLQDVAKVRSYVNDRAPSLKMLLEHLALSLPTLT